MMFVIHELLRGNTNLGAYCEKTVRRWETILAQEGARDPDELAKILTGEQSKFQADCDMHQSLSQELMVIVGFARLWGPVSEFRGHEGDLHLIRLGIARSGCSLEVKRSAEKLADYLNLPPLSDSDRR
jgi:hypothetical protein